MENPHAKVFGSNLKAARLANGLTQEALATKLDSSKQCISSWENGRTEPGFEELSLICAALDVSVDALMRAPAQEAA